MGRSGDMQIVHAHAVRTSILKTDTLQGQKAVAGMNSSYLVTILPCAKCIRHLQNVLGETSQHVSATSS